MGKHFKLNMIALAISMGVAGAASAQVYGGGATLPEKLYKGATGNPGLFQGLPNFTDFRYSTGIGSGGGKSAFATNDSNFIYPGVTPKVPVAFAGSDSVVDAPYISTYNARGWGPLIQIPAAGTTVTIPFNHAAGTNLNLDVDKICGIFSGRILSWAAVETGRTGAVRAVYRTGSSGTTELFTRYLKSVCPAENPATSRLEGGQYKVVSTFTDLLKKDVNGNPIIPPTFVPGSGSQGVHDSVYATAGGIGYVSPDYIADLDDATKVAQINGQSPNTGNAILALGTASAPATTADRADPLKWVPVFGNEPAEGEIPVPTVGYPIVGYTNFLVGQCYLDSTTEGRIEDLVAAQGNGDFDAKIEAHAFVPLPSAFQLEIKRTFVDDFYNEGLNIGNTSACGSNGRPATAS